MAGADPSAVEGCQNWTGSELYRDARAMRMFWPLKLPKVLELSGMVKVVLPVVVICQLTGTAPLPSLRLVGPQILSSGQ